MTPDEIRQADNTQTEAPRFRDSWPGRTWRLRTRHRVRGDFPFSGVQAPSRVYEHDEIDVNPNGAVSILATDRRWLGLKPGEMEWVSEPPWPTWPADNLTCRECGEHFGGQHERCWSCGSTNIEAAQCLQCCRCDAFFSLHNVSCPECGCLDRCRFPDEET